MAKSAVTKSESKAVPARQWRDTVGDRELGLEIDAILQRLETGIAQEKAAMSALLSKLRTTRVAA